MYFTRLRLEGKEDKIGLLTSFLLCVYFMDTSEQFDRKEYRWKGLRKVIAELSDKALTNRTL